MEGASVPHAPLSCDDPSLSLALALVCSSPTPLLMLNGSCEIIAASESFLAAFAIAPADAVGRPLFELGDGEWDVPQLRSLMDATASGAAAIESYELNLRPRGRPLRNLVLNVRKLDYGDPSQDRLMAAVAVSDVTQARVLAARDLALAQDNALLMKEERHRIANSLQIIASVMMLNARRTSSEETRGHLRDAHNRVMSIAELQQQLAVSTETSVAVRPYLTRLCGSISASMVVDPTALSIVVTAPDITIDPEVSVSLGLIVTELVINALKHGFPDEAEGTIAVGYECDGKSWTLSVADDGVGMPKGEPKAVAGLGTSIVQALARQLRARVEVSETGPGARVSIIHTASPAEPEGDPSLLQAAV
jgi:two-component sensor histidine kinase